MDVKISGKFTYEIIRKGNVIESGEIKNAVTTVGMNYALDTIFRGTSQISTWYCGLIDNASYTALAAGDTMASHTGWIELADYDEAARQTWTPSAASARAIANGTQMTFTISATKSVKGFFINSVSTKSGTLGTLWATGLFDTVRSVVDGDEIKVTYTVSG
jgi:hypothetical protein